MAIISRLFSAAELRRIQRKHHAKLLKEARRLVQTSPEIKKIIKKDRKIQRILRQKLRGHYERLKGR
jgi:hypothetical protein